MWAWQHVDGQPRARESEKIVFAEVLTLPKLHADVVRKSGPLTKHQNESVLRSDEGISRTENLSSHAKLGRVWSDETLRYK